MKGGAGSDRQCLALSLVILCNSGNIIGVCDISHPGKMAGIIGIYFSIFLPVN